VKESPLHPAADRLARNLDLPRAMGYEPKVAQIVNALREAFELGVMAGRLAEQERNWDPPR